MCPLPRRPAEPASSEHGAHHPAQTAEQKGDCALQSRCGHAQGLALLVQLPPILLPDDVPALPPLERSGTVNPETLSLPAALTNELFHPPRS
jgi:hypothetical protein